MKSSQYRGVTLFRPTGKWRAQISAGGKTLSLGDHDTEQDAARAFDRAVVHKSGREARTNFPISDYEGEIEALQAMTHQELVSLLRSRARRTGAQTSHYRGVSLLRQTGKWHAQINASGRQVHLGYFATEEEAARAYDRAAITKGVDEGGAAARILTNFALSDYAGELSVLQSVTQEELVAALADEGTRKASMELLAGGFTPEAASAVFGRPLGGPAPPPAVLDELLSKAERTLPKPPIATSSQVMAQQQQQQQQLQQEEAMEAGDGAGGAVGPAGSAAGAASSAQQQQQQQQPAGPAAGATSPVKPASRSPLPARSPLPPKTPQGLQGPSAPAPPPPRAEIPTALSGSAGVMAAAAAVAAAAFPASPPVKFERPQRRSSSASGAAAASGGGAKRSLSYLEEGTGEVPGEVGTAIQEAASPERSRRRKVARPARAAHA